MLTRPNPPEHTQEVARRLRLTRLAFKMKKAPWSRLVGISPQSWNNVEGSETGPASNRISVDEALKVCRATGVDLDWIFRGSRDRLPVDLALKIAELEKTTKPTAAKASREP